ncbi:hypothetical protein QNZ73_004585 [Vibrio parahaemolyticus]|nr:hypothetical protein [Vibrio parahaemolyticus]EGY8744443.1 hypothetical protein [Vibrio parahaemolyticus]EHE6936365.1 hypothetical protein [Vibrio parahaemolyticus]ELB2078575.1 hypothetical protein [Vibrio parahaemolyticus]ELB2100055.1 hypothetical protein [Vibrio parahaemolyticus]
MENEELQQLQLDLSTVVKIDLAMNMALTAFSFSCLLVLITLDVDSVLVELSASMLIVSGICFGYTVISRYHVLSLNSQVHIGHSSWAEESTKTLQFVGLLCFGVGFALLTLYISWLVLCAAVIAMRYCAGKHRTFREKLIYMPTMQELRPRK